ncbi:hypothetical protein C0J52_07305, partial [Blattella germanica]
FYGPVQENGEWRLRYNREIYELYNSPDIVTDIKIGRLRWAGHIQRMKPSEMVRKIMETKPKGRRQSRKTQLKMDGWHITRCQIPKIKKLVDGCQG